MQLPIDDRILEVLESDLILSPTIIAENIDKSREEVGRRLSILSERDAVERIERGRYKISNRGRKYLSGDIDAGEFGDE